MLNIPNNLHIADFCWWPKEVPTIGPKPSYGTGAKEASLYLPYQGDRSYVGGTSRINTFRICGY